ncbi:hypothetical protein DD581_30990 [Klebsiella pneumoniae]|nr:hypothetical protein DD581_30990 [Klebsiella pneumoniae]
MRVGKRKKKHSIGERNSSSLIITLLASIHNSIVMKMEKMASLSIEAWLLVGFAFHSQEYWCRLSTSTFLEKEMELFHFA